MAKNEKSSEAKVFSPQRFTPFLHKEFTSSDNVFWRDWLTEWEQLTDAVRMFNHLHLLFETGLDWRNEEVASFNEKTVAIRKEQLLFCLDIATAYGSYVRDVDVYRLGHCPITRIHIVLKAISLLVKKFFTVGSKSSEVDEWITNQGRFIIDPDVLPKVISLFEQGGYRYDIPATGKEHENRVLKEFMIFLAKLGWRKFSGYSSDFISPEQYKVLESARPEFVRILVDNNEVGYLQEHRASVSQQDIQVLRDIVFKPSYVGEKMPANIGEALCHSDNRKTAATLHVLETYFKYVSRMRGQLERVTNAHDYLAREKNTRIQRIFELKGKILEEKDINLVRELKAEYDSLTDAIPALELQFKAAQEAVEKLRNQRF